MVPTNSPKKDRPMELLLAVIAFIAGLFAVDIAAVNFGTDSREQIGDDWAR
jgi:hypothetical protein